MRALHLVPLLLLSATALADNDGVLEDRVRQLEATVTELQKEVQALKARTIVPQPPEQTKAYEIPVGTSPVLGDQGAKIHVVGFPDFQGPFRARLFPTLAEIVEDPELRGRVNVVFKQFPLSFHKDAKSTALMSMAVRELGGDKAFWAFAAKAFTNQHDLTEESLRRFADEVGVDGWQAHGFVQRKGLSAYAQELSADATVATVANVRGTPSLYVNGWQLSMRSVAGVKALIKEKGL